MIKLEKKEEKNEKKSWARILIWRIYFGCVLPHLTLNLDEVQWLERFSGLNGGHLQL